MAHHRLPAVVATVGLLSFLVGVARADVNPVLARAVSRRSHGGTNYDITLPLSGASGIECRRTGGNIAVALFFDQPITGGAAEVTAGQGFVAGAPSVTGSVMTLALGNVANAQEITLTISKVTSAAGGVLASTSFNIRLIEGDTNASGSVTAADVAQVKSQAGSSLSGFNFRQDVNCSGAVTAADVGLVKLRVGSSVAGGSTANTAPTISAIGDVSTETGTAKVSFNIGDSESSLDALALKATSDNPLLLPPGTSFAFSGTGASRTLTITSAVNQTGTAKVTVTVGDGLTTASRSFAVAVLATPTLYVASMLPPVGVQSQGWGLGWLRLDGDETGANVTVQTSNLTGLATELQLQTIDGALVDLKKLPVQADGSYRWEFPSDSVASIVAAIKSNGVLLQAATPKNPGEINGFLIAATGSSTFTPPPELAPVTSGPASQNEAARFLTQATFGPTLEEIANVQAVGYAQWLNKQFDPVATPPSLIYPVVYRRCTTSSADDDRLDVELSVEAWWKNAITGPDQLRQRVATALSEILVVSAREDALTLQAGGFATYYDLLVNDAFANFRALLKDVTLHPIMGQYLNMRGNMKAKAPNYNAPNENYAREILQLFSIGLVQLNPDGTLKLDAQGNPAPTYDQNVIQGFAQVFTGWDTDPEPVLIPTSQPSGMTRVINSYYNKPMVVNPSLHSTTSKLLLNGIVIPANETMDAAAASAELDRALDVIFNHPNVGPFICRQLIQRLICSNPSPAYVYRVASVFNNDGGGVRGNMQAVIKAILLDREARDLSWTNTPGYGHLREPIVRLANVIRAFHPISASGLFKVMETDAELLQSPLRAPNVFNFFDPSYMPPGVLTSIGVAGPEFQITSESSVFSGINLFRDGIYNSFKGKDVKCDLSYEINIASKPATGTNDLVEELNLLLMSGQMTQAMKNRVSASVNSIPASEVEARVKDAIFLISTSPQCAAQR
ncbi:MAG TPA: DUF1800 family protein [Tepidisphaeraceae bacterium]|jgi:uncharacterized protein (DUF1800 family)